MFQTLLGGPPRRVQSQTEQKLLADLLTKIASDNQTWDAWMRVLNRHPINNPIAQAALGSALAGASEAALKSYITSIDLQMPGKEGRQSVAICLASFRQAASPERARAMWTIAYERWSTWRFSQASAGARLLEITRSHLDYAVVGYAVECMDEAGRKRVREEISRELSAIEIRWHTSFVNCLADWNCLLSQFQPHAHASEVIETGKDWLTETNYYPFPPSNAYLMMMFHVG